MKTLPYKKISKFDLQLLFSNGFCCVYPTVSRPPKKIISTGIAIVQFAFKYVKCLHKSINKSILNIGYSVHYVWFLFLTIIYCFTLIDMKTICYFWKMETMVFINFLNVKYSDYLRAEGKWLGGGFEPIFKKNGHTFLLKREVLVMLPAHIRREVDFFQNSKNIEISEGNDFCWTQKLKIACNNMRDR